MRGTIIGALTGLLFAGTAIAADPSDVLARFIPAAKDQIELRQRVASGREAVLGLLRDPESVRFRNVWLRSSPRGTVLCGEFNAKNAFGGYSGFRGFVVAGDVAVLDGDDALGGYTFGTLSLNYCEGSRAVTPVKF